MVPELPPLWSLNRLSNWSFLTHFFASLILLETPIFIAFLYTFSFKMFKFEAKNWSKFQTFENQFERLSGRFVDPELPFKISPRMQATTKNDNNAKPKRFFLQKEAFWEKIEENLIICWPLVCWPFCGQRPRSAKNTIKQGVLLFFLLCFLWLVCPFQDKTTKQQNNNK